MIGSKKQFGAVLSVGLNCLLILIKLVVGLFCNSIGVLASAVDSVIDLVASLLAYGAIYISDAPPDEDHPFGHGKFEDFAGLVEAILIIVGAFFIVWQAIPRFLGDIPHAVEPMPGIIVMVISLVLDFVVSQWLFKIAKETESSALVADAHHLSTDVWSSLAIIGGLILVKVTGQTWIDPVMALVVAVLILMVGVRIVRQVFKHLVDTALPLEEEQEILALVHQTIPEANPVNITHLKTRRSGSHRLIVFNLQVDPNLTVEKAHQYTDAIEDALAERYPHSIVNIHIEPYYAVSVSSLT